MWGLLCGPHVRFQGLPVRSDNAPQEPCFQSPSLDPKRALSGGQKGDGWTPPSCPGFPAILMPRAEPQDKAGEKGNSQEGSCGDSGDEGHLCALASGSGTFRNGHSFPLIWSDGEPVCIYLAAPAKLLQLCPTLCDPMDCSPPGSSIHVIFQARVLEWSAIAFSSIYLNNMLIVLSRV